VKLYHPDQYDSTPWLRGFEHRVVRYGGLAIAYSFIGVAAMFGALGAVVPAICMTAITCVMLWRLL